MTQHQLFVANSNKMDFIEDNSINLIVTSPPYPMIEMWDELFTNQDSLIKKDLEEGKGYDAFNKMHSILNKIWKECDRVLAQNGFICINIGDATRTLCGEFQLYSKDGTLDYTVKEIIRSIDENFYNGLSRGDKCRVGRGISTLYNKGQIFYLDRGGTKGVTNTYHVVKH